MRIPWRSFLQVFAFPMLLLFYSFVPAIATDVTIAWDASASPGVAGYNIYVGTNSRTYGSPIIIGNQTTYTVTGLTPGLYYFAVTAHDANSDESDYSNEISATVTADATPLSIRITAPTSSSTYSTGASSLNLGGTASDDVAVTQVTWVNDRGGSGTATGTTGWSASGITLQSGTNVLTVTARDADGNTGTATLTATYNPSDTTPPSIIITAPTSSAAYSTGASSLNLGGTASDNVAVTQVTWVNNRGGSGTATGTTGWSASGITLQSGTNLLTVTARDAAGNIGTATLTATYNPSDTTPPSIIITAPTSSAAYSTGASSLNLGGTASDNVAVTQVTWVNNRGGSGTATGTTGWSASGITLQSGTNLLTVTARDAAGNIGTATLTATYTPPDTTPPSIIITAPTSSSAYSTGASSLNLGGTASDNVAVTQVTWVNNRGGSGTATGTTGWSASGITLQSGTNVLTVTARDAAGNTGTATLSVTYTPPDTTPPVPKITAPTSSAAYNTGVNSLNLGGTASDNVAVTQVTWVNNRGGSGAATGNASWSVSGITLQSGTNVLTVTARDAAGNAGTATLTVTYTPPDITPPVISAVASSNVTATSATISWTTDENSDGQVGYGQTTSYGTSTTLATALVMSHSQVLGGLAANTTYHYRVKSKDAAGNTAISGDYIFTTALDIYTGLVAAFSFDEGAGSTSADFSGNGNTALIHSAGWTAGKYGKALSFNGLGSYVSAGVTSLPGVNQPKTISFWAYLISGTSSVQSMLALANLGSNASVQYGNKGYQTGALGSGNTWLLVGTLPSVQVWHHFGYVFDGSQNRLYIDGVLSATSTILPSSGLVNSFQIGCGATGSQYFKGTIDDVRVYNRSLSLDELKAAMNTPVGRAGADAAPLSRTVSAAEALTPAREMALQPIVNPRIDIRLERQGYRQGETVSVDNLTISNPADLGRDVEVKTWISLPGAPPIPLDLGAADTMKLSAEFNQDFSAIPVLEIASDAPAGTGEINARLLDPVTGEVLDEKSKSFAIGGKGVRSAMPMIVPGDIEKGVVLERFESDSGPQYFVANRGASEAAIELKVWMEKPGANPIQVFSAGTDGSFVMPAGASMTINPAASLQALPGLYVLKSRILDAASGDILGENEKEIVIQ